MMSQLSQPSLSISSRDIGRNGAVPKRAAQCFRWLVIGLAARANRETSTGAFMQGDPGEPVIVPEDGMPASRQGHWMPRPGRPRRASHALFQLAADLTGRAPGRVQVDVVQAG